MGPLTRLAVAAVMVVAVAGIGTGQARAFDGFGSASATSVYGDSITFTVDLAGASPDVLEILLGSPGGDGDFVTPVTSGSGEATYVWDTSVDHVTPNTTITYQWRAIDDGVVTLSEEGSIRYRDDRPGLDWQSERLGEATVHWYGDREGLAVRFGDLAAVGVEQAERLLGTELAGPIDLFVYDSEEDFFGALGPGAREWTGAAAFSEIRTVFMWLGGGSAEYLERVVVHEVTHIVFHDATDNPFHEPARWLNEGIATWSETRDAGNERAIVASEVGGGLFAFEAIREQFPIGDRGAILSYAQGTTMVDMIIDTYGEGAIAAIMAALREGASDAEALESGTGETAANLYAAFFDEFGVDAPAPVAANPIPASNVDRPPADGVDPVPGNGSPEPAPPSRPGGGGSGPGLLVAIAAAVATLGVVVVAVAIGRRSASRRVE